MSKQICPPYSLLDLLYPNKTSSAHSDLLKKLDYFLQLYRCRRGGAYSSSNLVGVVEFEIKSILNFKQFHLGHSDLSLALPLEWVAWATVTNNEQKAKAQI